MIKCKACGIEGIHACLGDTSKFIWPTPEEWIAQCKELEDTFIEKEGMSRRDYFEKMFLGVWECTVDDKVFKEREDD